MKVTFKGNPVTLVGRNVKLNSRGFDFKFISKELQEFSLKDFQGKIKLINFPETNRAISSCASIVLPAI